MFCVSIEMLIMSLSVLLMSSACDSVLLLRLDVTYQRYDKKVSLLADTGLSRSAHKKFLENYVVFEEGVGPFDHPHATVTVPLFRELNNAKESEMAGFIMAILPFDIFVGDLLPDGVDGIYAVLRNSCQQTFTYEVMGSRVSLFSVLTSKWEGFMVPVSSHMHFLQNAQARYLGEGDQHDPSYDHLEVTVPLTENPVTEETTFSNCNYEFKLYPSKTFEGETQDNLPVIASVSAACVFLAIAVAFFMYSYFVAKRNRKIVDAAAKSNAIVLSLFPAHVRDKLLKTRDWGNMGKQKKNGEMDHLMESAASMGSDTFPVAGSQSETIAELFPSASGKARKLYRSFIS